MAKKKKRPRMPRWIWQAQTKNFNKEIKHFLSFLWWCGPQGCNNWNYKLARMFDRDERTIRRWLHRLKELKLIQIRLPYGKARVIYALFYLTKQDYLNKSSYVSHTQGWTKMSTILNTSEGEAIKSSPSSCKTAEAATPAARDFNRGGKPPAPPAVQGGSWAKSEIPIILWKHNRIKFLQDYGFTFHEAAARILTEHRYKLTTEEIFMMDEQMLIGLDYDNSLCFALKGRRMSKTISPAHRI